MFLFTSVVPPSIVFARLRSIPWSSWGSDSSYGSASAVHASASAPSRSVASSWSRWLSSPEWILRTLLSAPAGYSLAKLRPRGGGWLSFILLVAQMIPGIIMAMGFYAILLTSHLINTLPGLVVADSTIAVPFGVLVFTAFMTGIPDELMQAAKTDGAGSLRTFTAIVLPLSRNAVVTVSLFTFLWAWSDFIFASTLDSGGGRQPITLGIYHYIGNNNQQWNAIMATAVVASIPATVLLIIAQRYVAAGVTAGAVKD